MISVLDHNQLEGINQLTNLNLNQFDLRGKGKKINVFDWAWYGWRENKSNCFNLTKKKEVFFDEIEFVQDLTHKLKSKLSFTALSWIGSNIRR